MNHNRTESEDSEYLYSLAPEFQEIPDYLQINDSIPSAIFTLRYSGGESYESRNLAVPIGNWTIYSEIIYYHAMEQNITLHLIDTETEWGYNGSTIHYGDFTFSIIQVYSKIDGVIVESTHLDQVSDYFFSRSRLTRIALNPTSQGIIITGVTGMILLVTLAMLPRKNRKGVWKASRAIHLYYWSTVPSQSRMTSRFSGPFHL